jgi:hypothetical protein
MALFSLEMVRLAIEVSLKLATHTADIGVGPAEAAELSTGTDLSEVVEDPEDILLAGGTCVVYSSPGEWLDMMYLDSRRCSPDSPFPAFWAPKDVSGEVLHVPFIVRPVNPCNPLNWVECRMHNSLKRIIDTPAGRHLEPLAESRSRLRKIDALCECTR